MRLVELCRFRYAVKRLPVGSLRSAFQIQHRAINTKPKYERSPPVTEHIDLRVQPNPRAQSIGILGGGITGLTTAWHISRFIPDAKITVYEKDNRLGGWVDSETVEVDGGEVLFEWGPRSLRPDPAGAGRATILLLLQLGLQQEVIGVTKQAPSALNRFVYYDGNLVKMPGPRPNVPTIVNVIRNGYSILTEPIFRGALSIFAEPWVQPRPTSMTDESVGDFISRRFGQTVADNLASAFFHGIYAGDLYKLSARSLLPALWHMETRDPQGNGILGELTDLTLRGQGILQHKHGRYVDLLEAAADHDHSASALFVRDMHHEISVYTFGQGLRRLIERLEERLKKVSNFDFRTSANVTGLQFDPATKKTKVLTQGENVPLEHDYIVSTLSPGKLHDFISSSAKARCATSNQQDLAAIEKSNQSVSVAVVNLYYSNANLIPSNYQGFGYLIPRTVDVDQNPERALGVIFGSESSGQRGKSAVQHIPNPAKEGVNQAEAMLKAFAGSDVKLNEEQQKSHDEFVRNLEKEQARLAQEPDEMEVRMGQDTAPGTKLTVMLGGHWWDGWKAEDLPDQEACIDMAKTLLARHLKIMEAPLVAKAQINHDCIPQYRVGYRQRMASAHQALMAEFQGRLKVAGPWWQGGVGVNDSVYSAHMTAFNIREEWEDETGLKEYTEPEKWLVHDRRTHTFMLDQGKDRS